MKNVNKSSLKTLKTTEILSKHDLVFKNPVCDPTYGIPLGNGSLGCLLWFGDRALNININHTDLVDDTGDDDFYYKREDETHTVAKNGAKLTIDFGCPIFETIYQKDFEARLSLADATATVNAKTPFSSTSVRAFTSEEHNVAVISVDVDAEEEASLLATLERWGSRTFQYWYIRFAEKPEIGLSGVTTEVLDGGVSISQRIGGGAFAVAVRAVSEFQKPEFTRSSTHSADIRLPISKKHRLDLYVSLACADTDEQARADALALACRAAQLGIGAIYERHRADWESFWNRSFVTLPAADDVVENLWYLNLYYGNCEMKGKYPPHFCNGIWGFHHDFVPWNMYFHYNTQHAFNSYNAANHPELLNTYIDYRFRGLDIAKRYAREIKGTRGAFYTDICDMKGRMLVDYGELTKNCTCGGQIAMMLYKQYRYTGDKKLLAEKALPMMKEVGLFYLDMLKKGDDGKYHICDTTAYEGSPPFDDSLTDLVMIRALFGALIKELDEAEAAPFKQRLDSLADYTTASVPAEEMIDGKFPSGIGKGKEYRGNKVLTVGKIPKGSEGCFRGASLETDQKIEPSAGAAMRKTFALPEKRDNSYYGFPDIEMSPIYPAGIVGIKDKGTELYDLVYNSVCMHHTALEGESDPDKAGMCMGWCMVPIYLARLGMGDELAEQLRRSVSTWICFPQGFGFYGGYANPAGVESNTKRGMYARFNNCTVMNLDAGYRDEVVNFNRPYFNDKPECLSRLSLWNFRHFDLETLPILSCAINEMLVQSYDGTLRLFGAVKKESEYSFKLAAEGGYTVSAAYKNGEAFALIECAYDGELKLAVDNVNSPVSFANANGMKIKVDKNGEYYIIPTTAGMMLCMSSDGAGALDISINDERNGNFKALGDAMLGSFREL